MRKLRQPTRYLLSQKQTRQKITRGHAATHTSHDTMGAWWNWQTRMPQEHVGHRSVRVRVPGFPPYETATHSVKKWSIGRVARQRIANPYTGHPRAQVRILHAPPSPESMQDCRRQDGMLRHHSCRHHRERGGNGIRAGLRSLWDPRSLGGSTPSAPTTPTSTHNAFGSHRGNIDRLSLGQ